MKDGYYISSFVAGGELASAVDVKLRHDQTIALWKKTGITVELVNYWELERYSGWKQHTFTFASKEQIIDVVSYLLSTVGLNLADILEIWGSPIIDTVSDYHSVDIYPEITYHSICHLYSSFLFDSKNAKEKEMLILALDSGPEPLVQFDSYQKHYYAGAYVKNGKTTIFPIHSPGKLWSNSKKRFNMREGSLMALASACESRCKIDYEANVELFDETALDQTLDYLDGLEQHLKKYGYICDQRFSNQENYISAFMKQIDRKSRQILSDEIERAILRFEFDCSTVVLGLAGGFSLNCPTNTYLMDKYRFKELVIPPCTSDCGEALGIGLFAFAKKMKRIPEISIRHPFYGNPALAFTGSIKTKYEHFVESVERVKPDVIAEDITENVIAWVQGKAEIGPRALGHRSILGNPGKMEIKDQLNKIKQRQWWRPIAPIVMEDQVGLMYEQIRRSPFMLEAFKVKEEWKKKAPAIVHLDGTARVQTLNKQDNPLLYEVLECFFDRTGIPAICNTSLNDRGEPIIQETEEALTFALRKGISILYINDVRIQLRNHRDYNGNEPLPRNPWLFSHMSKVQVAETIRRCNPFGLQKDVLTYYFDNPTLCQKYDITKLDDCEIVKKEAETFMEKYVVSLHRELL